MSERRAEVRFLDRTTPPHIVTLVLLAGLAAMNMAAFLPALPRMTEHFSTRYEVMQLAVSLYLGVTGVLQLIIGPLSDRYGRRRVTLGCIAIFVLATLGCMLAPNAIVFLGFRMLQGAVAVGLVLSRAIVRDMFPQSEAASMIGYVTMGMALVPMIAPMIGGALNELFGWQSIFLFLIAAGVGVGALCWADQGETGIRGGKPFREQVRDYPELLRSARFWGYVFTTAFSSGAFFAFLGGAPYVASEVFGLSSFWAGVGFGAPAIGYATGNFLSGRYSAHVGIHPMIVAGALVTVAGMGASLLVSYAGLSTATLFFGFCTFVGLGNGMVIPNATAGMLSVRPDLAGTASGLGSFFMIGGGAVLSTLAGIALKMGGGAAPLQWLMFLSAGMSLASLGLLRARRGLPLAAKGDEPSPSA